MLADPREKTGLGNYFVANYPPFSRWKPTYLPDARAALRRAAATRHAAGAVSAHSLLPQALQVLLLPRLHRQERPRRRDLHRCPRQGNRAVQPACRSWAAGRSVRLFRRRHAFVSQRGAAARPDDRLQAQIPWDQAEEVTFECEPGTLAAAQARNAARAGRHAAEPGHREFRATRSSRTTAGPICRPRSTAPTAGPATSAFEQINIDLIAGMVGETWDNWRDCVRKTIELAPDSVTIYQMELPFNTVFSKDQVLGQDESSRRQWPTGRPSGPGSTTPSTRCRRPATRCRAPTRWSRTRQTQLHLSRQPLARRRHVRHRRGLVRPRQRRAHAERRYAGSSTSACSTAANCRWAGRCRSTPDQLLVREMILQLKTGRLRADYFRRKFGVRHPRRASATASGQLAERWLPDAATATASS